MRPKLSIVSHTQRIRNSNFSFCVQKMHFQSSHKWHLASVALIFHLYFSLVLNLRDSDLDQSAISTFCERSGSRPQLLVLKIDMRPGTPEIGGMPGTLYPLLPQKGGNGGGGALHNSIVCKFMVYQDRLQQIYCS